MQVLVGYIRALSREVAGMSFYFEHRGSQGLGERYM